MQKSPCGCHGRRPALGLSKRDADALEQALGVKTVGGLAENRHVRRAQAIMTVASVLSVQEEQIWDRIFQPIIQS